MLQAIIGILREDAQSLQAFQDASSIGPSPLASQGQIFLPNFTTKTGGSGVGLSLTYNIVQAAGGTISFESQEGKGAEFIITLPKP